MAKAFRIRDWAKHFENNRTRDLISMPWLPLTTRQDGFSYISLVDGPLGAARLGVWIGLIQTAAKCNPRGLLVRSDGLPHDSTSIHLVSRLPIAAIDEAIPRLQDIGWLETCDVPEVANPPALGAGCLRDGCGEPATSAHYSTVENSTAAAPPQADREAAAAAVFGLGKFSREFAIAVSVQHPPQFVHACVKRYLVERDKPNSKGIRNPVAFLKTLLKGGVTTPDPKRTQGYPSAPAAPITPPPEPASPPPENMTPEGIEAGRAFLKRRRPIAQGGAS